MKKSLKPTRSRKGRKRAEEVSSSDKDSDSSRDELLQNIKKAKSKQIEAKTTKKRKLEPEKASVPSPPATKKRKKRNLTRSDSVLAIDNQSSGSNSSQESPQNSSSISSANSNDITQSSEFAQYLKVRIFVKIVGSCRKNWNSRLNCRILQENL